MYTLLDLQSKTFGELRKIGDELNVLPKGDRRYRQSWIDAIVGVNPPLLQLLEGSPAASVDPVSEAIEVQAQEAPLESKFGRIVYPQPAQKAIAQAAKNRIDAEVDRVPEAIAQAAETSPGVEPRLTQKAQQHKFFLCLKQGDNTLWYDGKDFVCEKWSAKTYCKRGVGAAKHQLRAHPVVKQVFCSFGNLLEVIENSPRIEPTEVQIQEQIAQAANISLGSKSDLNPILTIADAWDTADFGEVQHKAEADGQLNLLEWDVNESPEPDDYKGDMFAFQAAYDRWLLTSDLHEIIHTKNSPGITQTPEPIAQNATTRLEIPRNESADVRYELSHPPQPDGNYSSAETVGQGDQEGDRVLEVAGNFQADRGRVIPHQPTQLSPHDSHIKPPGRGDGRVDLGLEIGMLVGRRRDRHHLGKIIEIYKSRRGIWRAKIQPLNKSNFVYFDCDGLVEQRLLYDYEMKPGGFLPSSSTFDKARGEKFEVYSRKVRSPKPTNWTAAELSSLSTFKLKQIARDIEIPSIPGTAGKRSLIRAILAEQAISQEKAAAQRERETGRAIVAQQQKSAPASKKRAAASSLGNQLSLFEVAV